MTDRSISPADLIPNADQAPIMKMCELIALLSIPRD